MNTIKLTGMTQWNLRVRNGWFRVGRWVFRWNTDWTAEYTLFSISRTGAPRK